MPHPEIVIYLILVTALSVRYRTVERQGYFLSMRNEMKRLFCLVWLVISFPVLAACSFQGTIVSFDQEMIVAPGYKDPHTACDRCHGISQPKGDSALFPPEVDPSKLCLGCHNYRVNHHPVFIAPVKTVKSLFPLFDGKITCLTCHEIHGGPEHKGTSRLLRGGPYSDRRKICFGCHPREQYAAINPHHMQDDAGRRFVVNGETVCLFCHELQPDPSQDKANTVLFKADITFLCLRCHPPMHGDFIEKHFLVMPSEKYLTYMNSPEVQEKFTVPLVPRSRITCSTCHNPHQAGIISFEPAAAGADSRHRLRSNNICVACHNK
jgi:predicted CXXCH cytochrome family protein